MKCCWKKTWRLALTGLVSFNILIGPACIAVPSLSKQEKWKRLVSAAKDQNPQAFDSLISDEIKKIESAVEKRIYDGEDPGDVVNSVLSRFWEVLATIENPAKVPCLLYKIIKGKVIDRNRQIDKERRQRPVLMLDAMTDQQLAEIELKTALPSYEDQLIERLIRAEGLVSTEAWLKSFVEHATELPTKLSPTLREAYNKIVLCFAAEGQYCMKWVKAEWSAAGEAKSRSLITMQWNRICKQAETYQSLNLKAAAEKAAKDPEVRQVMQGLFRIVARRLDIPIK